MSATTTGRPPPPPRISLPGAREINARHEALGGNSGFPGAPTEGFDETPNRRGWYRHHRHGPIHWTRETGAHEVHGMIRAGWEATGWENSPLGFPTSGELPCADRAGRFGTFERGVILWSPATGAHEVCGMILDWCRQLGLERSSSATRPAARRIWRSPAAGASTPTGAARSPGRPPAAPGCPAPATIPRRGATVPRRGATVPAASG